MSQTTTTKGLKLPCIVCGAANARVLLHLDDADTFTCGECDGEFTADDVRHVMVRWSGVLAWIEIMPREEE